MHRPEINYLTSPMPVSMGDAWFEIAVPNHFWMIRRIDVTCALAANIIVSAKKIAEIGCGNGVLQEQIETRFGREVDGFDLNDYALKLGIAPRSARYCYNILECRSDLREKYDVIFLFDIIEHIDNEDAFIEAVMHHLAPGGYIIINAPAAQWLFSRYDRAAGHVRRYTISMLKQLAGKHCLIPREISYWGLPMVPLLIIRKFLLAVKNSTDSEVLRQGFAPPSPIWNQIIGAVARLELLPQQFLGSSVFAVLQKKMDSPAENASPSQP